MEKVDFCPHIKFLENFVKLCEALWNIRYFPIDILISNYLVKKKKLNSVAQ